MSDLKRNSEIVDDKVSIVDEDMLSLESLSLLLILNNVVLFIWTIIPVLIEGEEITYLGYVHPEDVLRFTNPYVNATILFAIILPILPRFFQIEKGKSKTAFLRLLFFGLSWALYLVGCGTHGGSALAKNSVEVATERSILDASSPAYKALDEVHFFLKESLEHKFGHYLYAIGYEMLAWNIIHGYWSHPEDITFSFQWKSKLGFSLSIGIILRALLLTAVGFQFPSGPLIVFLYSFISLVLILVYRIRVERQKKLTFIQKFSVLSFGICALALMIRMMSAGNFKGRNDIKG